MTRLEILRTKMKEQRKHMDELDKHLYVVVLITLEKLQIRTHVAEFLFQKLTYTSEEYIKSQGGEQN